MSDQSTFSEGHLGAEVSWLFSGVSVIWQHLGPGSDTQPPVPADFQHL